MPRTRGTPPIWVSSLRVYRAHLRQTGADLRHLLLAAVPAERLLRLRVLDPDRYQWVAGSGWPESVDAIRAKPVEMAVVDPLLGGEARAHGIERIRLLFPFSPPAHLHRAGSRHRFGAAAAGTSRNSPGRVSPLRGRPRLASECPPGRAGAERVAAGHAGAGRGISGAASGDAAGPGGACCTPGTKPPPSRPWQSGRS